MSERTLAARFSPVCGALSLLLMSCASVALPPDSSAQLRDLGVFPDLVAPLDTDAALGAVDLLAVDQSLPPDLATPPDLALSTCALALQMPSSATDAQLTSCALGNQLGKCHVVTCASGCACTTYVRADGICTGGSCGAPINGTGCSDASYYSGSPWNCTATPETGCMLRRLIEWNDCQ